MWWYITGPRTSTVEIINQVFNCSVISIPEDHMGCAAALTSGKVASSSSEYIAQAIDNWRQK
jgi:hypothetical protein